RVPEIPPLRGAVPWLRAREVRGLRVRAARAFSCKGRAICPSCGGRRMAERAAHLVDHVLPADVPVRQWVLSVPHRLRYRLAYDHRLCRTALHVFVRALRSAYRRQARRQGLAGGETGMVTSVQRFGGSVNVHLHFHTLVLDGMFVREPDGTLRFHPAAPPTDEDVRRVVARVRRRLERLGLAGARLSDEDTDPLADESAALASLSRAAILGRADRIPVKRPPCPRNRVRYRDGRHIPPTQNEPGGRSGRQERARWLRWRTTGLWGSSKYRVMAWSRHIYPSSPSLAN